MPEQTIQLPAIWYTGSLKQWMAPQGGLRPQIDAALLPAFTSRAFGNLEIRDDAEIHLYFADTNFDLPIDQGDDLSSEFEQSGSIEIVAGGLSVLVEMAGQDTAEPYIIVPTNSAEVLALRAALSDDDGSESGQLIIRDFVPAAAVDHAVDAGDASFAFALPQPTVTHTAAPTVELVLSDFVLADGLETEALALIEAAAPIDVFSRSPRPARGTLVDGELDLSGDSEPVTRFRFRAQATNTAGGARITLNDSGTLSLADFFGSGGAGADLTVWVQTSAGVISFASLGAIADSTQSGDHFVTWAVPTNDQLLVAGITDGDLFIFALTRPEPESEDHAVDAGDAAFAFNIPQLSITHVPFVTPATTDHVVNAGDAAFAFAAPEPTVTHTPASSGETVSVTVPLTGVSVFTNYIRWSDNQSLGSLFSADGGDQTLTTVDLNSGSPSGQVFISIIGTDNRFTPAFEASGTIIFEASDGETLEVMIADADMSEPYMWVPLASVLEVVAFVNHIRTLTDQTATLTLRGEGVAVTDHAVNAGDASWAFAVSEPTVTHVPVVTDDHAVNAGDAAFAFAVPQPSVTHTLASGTVAHAVNAGGIAFTFAVPQPTRTHIQAVADDHAVNAGDLNWGFDVPQLSITHTTVVTQAHAVNAGEAAWTFYLPQPLVTGGSPVFIGGMVTAYIGGAIQPIETASLQITRRVGERPIAECDLFFRNINLFRRPRRGEQLEIHESAVPLALSATDDFPVLSFGGEAALSFGGEAVISLGGRSVLDPAIPTTLLFGGTVLDSKITLTHADRIGRCIVTGTGYAALLDITIKERYATVHDATCAEVILDLLMTYASGLGLTFSATSIIASDICPDLIFGYQSLSEALTLVADAGNVVWCVDERGVFVARSRDHLIRFDATTRGAGFSVREGVGGTAERIEHKEDPTNFANEVTVIGSAPQISTARDVFTGDGATTSWALAYQVDAVTDVDVVDGTGSIQEVDSFGGDGDAWQVDTRQARIMQRDGDAALADGWQVRVTYNFHLPVIFTAKDDVSIATYGLVAAVEEDPELDTIESVSQRAKSRLRRHTYPTQILDIILRPGTSGPFEGHGVPILLPRHGVNSEIWLVEEVEIEELESQLLQWRLTLLQRDHESLYAQSVKPIRIQPSEPANIGAIPGIQTVLTDASRIGSESDLFSAFLGGSHAERITSNSWTDVPGGAVAQLHGAVFGTSAIQWFVTAKLVQPTDGPAVTAAVRLYNRTTGEARGAVVGVTSPNADFHGSTRLALDDSLNRYVLQGRIVERSILSDSGFSAGLYCWAGEFVKPR